MKLILKLALSILELHINYGILTNLTFLKNRLQNSIILKNNFTFVDLK